MTRRGIELRRGVAPPLLEEREVVGGHHLLGERHLEEVRVPDSLVPLVAGGQRAADRGGVRRADGDQAGDLLGTERRRTVRRGGAPVVADDERVTVAQRVDEGQRVLGQQHRLVAPVGCQRGGRVAAHERRHRVKAGGGQRRQELIVRVRVVGEAVQAQRQRSSPGLEVVEAHAVGLHGAARRRHGATRGARRQGPRAPSAGGGSRDPSRRRPSPS